MWTQPVLMSVGLTATALEIPFSNVLLAPAIAPDASLLFPAVACARSDAFPANNVAQTARAFPRQDASPNRARQSPLRPSPDRGTPFPAHALFVDLPGIAIHRSRGLFRLGAWRGGGSLRTFEPCGPCGCAFANPEPMIKTAIVAIAATMFAY